MINKVENHHKDLLKDDQQVEGIVKGMLIQKKLEKEKVNMKEIVAEVMLEAKSETA